jgi:hypothetical protein
MSTYAPTPNGFPISVVIRPPATRVGSCNTVLLAEYTVAPPSEVVYACNKCPAAMYGLFIGQLFLDWFVSGMLMLQKLNDQVFTSDTRPVGPRHGLARRSVLATCGIVTTAAAFHLGSRPRREMLDVSVATCVSGLFSDLTGCQRLGRQYLDAHPEEADIGILVALLCDSEVGPCPPDDPTTLRRSIAERCASDFRTDRIAHIDGWILARTEARACALVALT